MRSGGFKPSAVSGWLAGALALTFAASAAAQIRTPEPPSKAMARPAAKKPAPIAAPQAPAVSSAVEVHTSVSQTAIWVGDRVAYSIELRCAPDVDIVTDDFAKERLHVDGLEIRDMAIERDANDAGRLTYRVNYNLVTFNLEAKNYGIGEIPVRYSIRKAGQRAEDQSHPAGVVRIPALKLVLRSTLLDGEVPVEIHDGRPLRPLPRRMALAQPVGIGLLVLAAAPVGVLIFTLVRRARSSRSKGPRRVTRRERRATLDEIKALDVATPDERRDAYAKLDAWVRDHAQQATGVTAAALTPPELAGAITQPERAAYLAQVQTLVTECERAKYAPQPPDAAHWSSALIEAEQLLDAKA